MHLAAFHYDHPIVIFLFVIAGLLRWFSEKQKNANRPSPPVEPPRETRPLSRPAPADSDEERVRKFMEALGRPTTSAPPPRRVRPQRPARRPILPIDPFPKPGVPPFFPIPEARELVPVPPELPAPAEEMPTLPPPVGATPPAAPIAARPSAFEVESEAEERAGLLHDISALGSEQLAGARRPSLLGSAAELRRAIILREVLGPPRSLQPEMQAL